MIALIYREGLKFGGGGLFGDVMVGPNDLGKLELQQRIDEVENHYDTGENGVKVVV